MGEYETFNFSIGIIPEDIALFHALYRTSIKARKDLIELMFSDGNDETAINLLDHTYTSRVAEIFNVILKNLGIELEFIDEDDKVQILNDDIITEHQLDGKTYFCTDYQFFVIERMNQIREEILEEYPVILENKLEQMVEKEMKRRKYINGPLNDELGGLSFLKPDEDEKKEEAPKEEVKEKTTEEVKTE